MNSIRSLIGFYASGSSGGVVDRKFFLLVAKRACVCVCGKCFFSSNQLPCSWCV
jgi:hypothetical protein